MSQADQTLMREWAQEHGKAVWQRTVRQCTTKRYAGTLPLNMYEKGVTYLGESNLWKRPSRFRIWLWLWRGRKRISRRPRRRFPWPQCYQLFIKIKSYSLWQSYFFVTSSSNFVPIDQYFFERSSAATLLCLRPRSPVAGFSHFLFAHQTHLCHYSLWDKVNFTTTIPS